MIETKASNTKCRALDLNSEFLSKVIAKHIKTYFNIPNIFDFIHCSYTAVKINLSL